MTTYALATSRYTSAAELQNAVGSLYHLGLSCVLPDSTSRFYGYVLKPDASPAQFGTRYGGFRQRSDTAAKDSLIQYSSANLVDRDFTYFPRVTDGDFSGGGYQEVFIDTRKYFDSDLDPRVPGFLQLRAQWTRVSKTGITAGTNYQVVPFNGDFFFTFGEASGNVYSANGGATGTASGGAVLSLDTDGTLLYAGTATGLWSSTNGASWTQITTTINGTATQWWVVNQGSNGYFAYYQSGPNLLYKIDLTLASPQLAAAQPQVGVGANAINIVDLVEFQTSIAILTTDVRGPGFDLWYFDGTNLTRIIRVEGYTAQGMCNALGGLYVSAYAVGQKTSPILAHIDNGTYEVVARPGSPFPTSGQFCQQPRASSQYVYWPIIAPSINGISSANGVVVQYDVLTGAVTRLPNQDSGDFTTPGGSLRTVAALGDTLAICYLNGTTGVLQYQQPAFGTLTYQASGWLASSHIDFTTPGITKRFRRVEVHHAPLAAGEAILIEAFVDRDPITFTTALAPVPATATATNTTLGSTTTSLTFGIDTIGKTMFYGLQLTAGTGQATTPRVNNVTTEIGGTWTWLFTLACTSKRQLLDGTNEDSQGVTGKDLAYMLLLAYENGQTLTLYHRNGGSYTVAIESMDLWNPSPLSSSRAQDAKDEEYEVTCVLRQVA